MSLDQNLFINNKGLPNENNVKSKDVEDKLKEFRQTTSSVFKTFGTPEFQQLPDFRYESTIRLTSVYVVYVHMRCFHSLVGISFWIKI